MQYWFAGTVYYWGLLAWAWWWPILWWRGSPTIHNLFSDLPSTGGEPFYLRNPLNLKQLMQGFAWLVFSARILWLVGLSPPLLRRHLLDNDLRHNLCSPGVLCSNHVIDGYWPRSPGQVRWRDHRDEVNCNQVWWPDWPLSVLLCHHHAIKPRLLWLSDRPDLALLSFAWCVSGWGNANLPLTYVVQGELELI